MSTAKRSITPLRRLSASSLRSLSRRSSQNFEHDVAEPEEDPLEHLGMVFAELADAMSDLTGNVEKLAVVNEILDGFNESFGTYLYGLRVNCYTADFDEAPTKRNFDLLREAREAAAAERLRVQREAARQEEEQKEQEIKKKQSLEQTKLPGNGEETKRPSTRQGAHHAPSKPRTGFKTTTAAQRKKAELRVFCDTITRQLPPKFRDQQPLRGYTEKVISVLNENRGVPLDVSAFAPLLPAVPPKTVTECLNAMVRTKAVIKSLVKGVSCYRLDPLKFPSQ